VPHIENEAERRKIKSRMQKTQLGLEHTQKCTLLPDRLHLLDRMPKNASVAEIGVAFGDYSKEIIRRCMPKKLILIDSWGSDRYREGLKSIETEFDSLIKNNTVEVLMGQSTQVLADLEPGTFDWAYIDTNHTYDTTLAELELCERIVGKNGRISGHDFCTGNVVGAVPYGVVEAATRFCKENGWQFEYLTVESHGHFSFCLKKL
jgi:predicted O-methyltransferase YrrM